MPTSRHASHPAGRAPTGSPATPRTRQGPPRRPCRPRFDGSPSGKPPPNSVNSAEWTQTGSPKRFGQKPSRVRPAFDWAEIRRLFRRSGWRSGRPPGIPGRGRNGRTFTHGPPAKPGDPGERADCDPWWIRLRLRGRSCLLSGSSRSTVAVGRSSSGPARRHHRVLAGGPAAYGPLAGNASVGVPIASAMTARKSRTL